MNYRPDLDEEHEKFVEAKRHQVVEETKQDLLRQRLFRQERRQAMRYRKMENEEKRLLGRVKVTDLQGNSPEEYFETMRSVKGVHAKTWKGLNRKVL